MSRKPAKYRAQPTEVDGIRFASKAEAARYRQLKLLEKAGHIRGLLLQPAFVLHAPSPSGLVKVGRYVADFAYMADGALVYEDVKGMRTPQYRWKKKHVEAEYGIEIREVTR